MVNDQRNVGLFGGSFDPFHLGHFILSLDAKEALDLDEIWFVPVADPPLKSNKLLAPARCRLDMARIATERLDGFDVWEGEIEREGTSYTIDTARQLHRDFPSIRFFFMMGADRFHDFPDWREAEALCDLFEFIIFSRPGYGLTPNPELPANMRWHSTRERYLDISSSEIRERIATGQPVEPFLPHGVHTYIKQNKLYLTQNTEAESISPAYGL